MRYLLDTNTCIAYLNRSSQAIYENLLAQSPDDVCICAVVKFELYYGAYRSVRQDSNLETLKVLFSEFVSLPFDGRAAAICGAIRADLQSKGTLIGAYDLQIAAIALANDLILVTNNTREFERVTGLSLVNWQ